MRDFCLRIAIRYKRTILSLHQISKTIAIIIFLNQSLYPVYKSKRCKKVIEKILFIRLLGEWHPTFRFVIERIAWYCAHSEIVSKTSANIKRAAAKRKSKRTPLRTPVRDSARSKEFCVSYGGTAMAKQALARISEI